MKDNLFRRSFSVSNSGHPLVCSRYHAERHPSEYLRALILDDMYCEDILRCEHENTKPMAEDAPDIDYSLRLYRGRDDDIIEHLEKQENVSGYIRGLIYWDMGIDPDKDRPAGCGRKHNSLPSIKGIELFPILAEALLEVYEQYKNT